MSTDKIIIGSHWPTADPDWKEWGWKYSFTTNAPIPKEKWLEIIPAIEKILNAHP